MTPQEGKLSDANRQLWQMIFWMIDQALSTVLLKKKFEDPERADRGMLFKFKMPRRKSQDDFYTADVLNVLLWAPANYVYVLVRTDSRDDERKTGEWVFHCCHDSCWRQSLEDVIREHQDAIEGFDNIPAYTLIKINAEQKELFRLLRKQGTYGGMDMTDEDRAKVAELQKAVIAKTDPRFE
jgi:hypothetical protein